MSTRSLALVIVSTLLVAMIAVPVAAGSKSGPEAEAMSCDVTEWLTTEKVEKAISGDPATTRELERQMQYQLACDRKTVRTMRKHEQILAQCQGRLAEMSRSEERRGCIPDSEAESFDKLGCFPAGMLDNLRCGVSTDKLAANGPLASGDATPICPEGVNYGDKFWMKTVCVDGDGLLDVEPWYDEDEPPLIYHGALTWQEYLATIGEVIDYQKDFLSALGPQLSDQQEHLDGVAATIRNLETDTEEVRNKRSELQTSFENFDQKANQLFNVLSTVLKSMKDTLSAIQNLL